MNDKPTIEIVPIPQEIIDLLNRILDQNNTILKMNIQLLQNLIQPLALPSSEFATEDLKKWLKR